MHNPNSYSLVVETSLMKEGPNTQIILEKIFCKSSTTSPMMWLVVYLPKLLFAMQSHVPGSQTLMV